MFLINHIYVNCTYYKYNTTSQMWFDQNSRSYSTPWFG